MWLNYNLFNTLYVKNNEVVQVSKLEYTQQEQKKRRGGRDNLKKRGQVIIKAEKIRLIQDGIEKNELTLAHCGEHTYDTKKVRNQKTFQIIVSSPCSKNHIPNCYKSYKNINIFKP